MDLKYRVLILPFIFVAWAMLWHYASHECPLMQDFWLEESRQHYRHNAIGVWAAVACCLASAAFVFWDVGAE